MKLRPHHLFCMQFFVGRGYDAAFTKNMTRIHASLHTDPDQLVELVFSADDLCTHCPHLQSGSTCDSEEKVRRFDRNVISLLKLKEEPCRYRTLQMIRYRYIPHPQEELFL